MSAFCITRMCVCVFNKSEIIAILMLCKCLINISEVAYFVIYQDVLGMSSLQALLRTAHLIYAAKSQAFD